MHKRPVGKHHAGLWEFPGGKVEHSEIPVFSLVRELKEELGIDVDVTDCSPVAFAEEAADDSEQPIVILLYTISQWDGEPEALEGGAIDWFSPSAIARLDKPPLDDALAAKLFAEN